jgi:hypothetical protein
MERAAQEKEHVPFMGSNVLALQQVRLQQLSFPLPMQLQRALSCSAAYELGTRAVCDDPIYGTVLAELDQDQWWKVAGNHYRYIFVVSKIHVRHTLQTRATKQSTWFT